MSRMKRLIDCIKNAVAKEVRAASAQHELDENIEYHMDDLQDQYELLKLSRPDPWDDADMYNFDKGKFNFIKGKKMDTNLLFQLTTRAVCHLYAEDPTRPSVVVSFLPNKRFYISIVRYKQRFAKEKSVVYKVEHEDFEEAVKQIADWVSKNKPASKNPLDDLKEFLHELP